MAHADYECCAVCDSKMSFGSDFDAKTGLCVRCGVELTKHGVIVKSASELLDWMKSAPPAKILSALSLCGFQKCCYSNEIDGYFEKAEREAVAARAEREGA